ncbi:MAG: RIP metalloprotease RseP, partial [Firmicutes bacterium]|nr:RIP metalloprotease RseP [Bacillota bacterium]
GTLYALRLLPLGGFVRMAGMDPNEQGVPPELNFQNKPVWQRVAIITAGPAMNFVLAVLLLAVVFIAQGVPRASTVIQQVLPDYPAAAAGLASGDRVVAVNGQPVATWEELVQKVQTRAGSELKLTVERGGRTLDFVLVPVADESGQGKIGITPAIEFHRMGVLAGLASGLEYTGRLTSLIVTFVGKMFTREAPVDLAGPVRVAWEIGQAAQFGFFPLVQLAAFLSINLGLFNLLPIPALDGSRIVFLAWEGVRGRPVDPAKENLVHLIGLGLLLLLM